MSAKRTTSSTIMTAVMYGTISFPPSISLTDLEETEKDLETKVDVDLTFHPKVHADSPSSLSVSNQPMRYHPDGSITLLSAESETGQRHTLKQAGANDAVVFALRGETEISDGPTWRTADGTEVLRLKYQGTWSQTVGSIGVRGQGTFLATVRI